MIQASFALVAAAALVLGGCFGHVHAPDAESGPPPRELQVFDLSDAEDESLHTSCRYGGLSTAPSGAALLATSSPDANVAERLYTEDAHEIIATFACAERPSWFVGGWAGPVTNRSDPGY